MSDNVEFVVASASERGEVASYLLALADEKGISRKEVRKARGGYLVPVELLNGIEADVEPIRRDDERAAELEAKDLPGVDVEVDSDGNHVLNDEADARVKAELEPSPEVDREVIRQWAIDQGYTVAKQGALSKKILAAYHEAN